MLRGTKGFKSFCKAPSHEFGCPDISNFIQPLLKLSHRLGHRRQFSTTAASWKTLHDSHLTVLNRAVWREIQQMCRDTGFFFPVLFWCKWNAFQLLSSGECLAHMIKRQDVYQANVCDLFWDPLPASIASLPKIKKEQRIMQYRAKIIKRSN